MAKFNPSKEKSAKTVNHMGATALKQTPELEFASLTLTTFAEDKYYEGLKETIGRMKELMQKCDKKFIAQCAVYARTKFGMRSITHIIAAELAKDASGQEWAKNFYSEIVHRPDDMLEIISYYQANCAENTKNKRGKKHITKAMKIGFANAFNKFDAYSLAKYRGENKEFKMIDAINIIHPTPIQKNKEAIDALVKGKLKSFDTWETELTKAGQTANSEEELADLKKDAWAKLIKTGKIGIFAVLRNLRNILLQAPESIDGALKILTDPERIKKSLILPFRYLTAYNEIEKMDNTKVFEKDSADNDKVLKAIEQAIITSIDNLPVFEGKTVILSDNSGSMRGDAGGSSMVSRMSQTRTSAIANLFALMYWIKADNTLMGVFGDTLIHPKVDRKKGLFENFKIVDEAGANCGGGTERGVFDMFERLIKEKIIANTIVIFSDCQIGTGCKWYDNYGNKGDNFMKLFSEYKKINPSFRCYSVDLHGYGTTVFDGSVIKIAGWSEKIFDIMKFAEQDKNALIKEIKKVAL